jgi:hypothetical protein
MKSLRKWFITGSMAYGTFTPDSDIDIVCLYDEFEDTINFLKTQFNILCVRPSAYFDGVYLHRSHGCCINLISLSKLEYNKWLFATRMMKALPPFKDKEKRINACERIKESLSLYMDVISFEIENQEIEIN